MPEATETAEIPADRRKPALELGDAHQVAEPVPRPLKKVALPSYMPAQRSWRLSGI
jgi:hypothetical protein